MNIKITLGNMCENDNVNTLVGTLGGGDQRKKGELQLAIILTMIILLLIGC